MLNTPHSTCRKNVLPTTKDSTTTPATYTKNKEKMSVTHAIYEPSFRNLNLSRYTSFPGSNHNNADIAGPITSTIIDPRSHGDLSNVIGKCFWISIPANIDTAIRQHRTIKPVNRFTTFILSHLHSGIWSQAEKILPKRILFVLL